MNGFANRWKGRATGGSTALPDGAASGQPGTGGAGRGRRDRDVEEDSLPTMDLDVNH